VSEYQPGLEGVPATKSSISYLDGKQGILTYRGYRLLDLAENSTFEETAYLLLDGELPTADQLAEFDAQLRVHRRVKYNVRDIMKLLPATGHPMEMLQTAVASLGMFYPNDVPVQIRNPGDASDVYVQPGEYDEFYAFISGGFSGQMSVYGLPSGRLLKVIPVFSVDAEKGYGFNEETKPMLETSYGFVPWDDSHHPELSQTDGQTDGRWVFINGNNTPRIARIDLSTFETAEIIEDVVVDEVIAERWIG